MTEWCVTKVMPHGNSLAEILVEGQCAADCASNLANFKGMYGITRWNMVIVYVLMLIVILIKPQGLMGKPIVKKV